MATYIRKADLKNPAIFDRQKALADSRNEDLTHVDVPVTISRSDARDPAKYRATKEMAAAVGEQIQVIEDGAAPDDKTPPDDQISAVADILAKKDHLVTSDSIYLPNGYDHETYKRLRTKAEKETLKLRPIASWDDLPAHVTDGLSV